MSFMMQGRVLLLATMLAVAGMASPTSADVIFNTLDPAPPPTVTNDGYVTMSNANNYWQSQAFTTGSSAPSINQITFDMLSFGGATFDINLYPSTGSIPNTAVAPVTLYSRLSSAGGFSSPLVTTFSPVSLAANSEYFVVVERVNPSTDSILWGYTNDVSGNNAYSSDGGSTWTASSSAPMRMKVETVPEPSTLVMVFAGLAWGGCAMWRRRPRA